MHSKGSELIWIEPRKHGSKLITILSFWIWYKWWGIKIRYMMLCDKQRSQNVSARLWKIASILAIEMLWWNWWRERQPYTLTESWRLKMDLYRALRCYQILKIWWLQLLKQTSWQIKLITTIGTKLAQSLGPLWWVYCQNDWEVTWYPMWSLFSWKGKTEEYQQRLEGQQWSCRRKSLCWYQFHQRRTLWRIKILGFSCQLLLKLLLELLSEP